MASLKTLMAALLAALLGSATLAACNTMEGLGQDIERGGENLQDTARETQQRM